MDQRCLKSVKFIDVNAFKFKTCTGNRTETDKKSSFIVAFVRLRISEN